MNGSDLPKIKGDFQREFRDRNDFPLADSGEKRLNLIFMSSRSLSLRQHLWISLALGAAVLAVYFLAIRDDGSPARHASDTAGTPTRPIHLAALDPQPDLPEYLLQLCGPKVLETHGGMTATGEMPDWFQQAAKSLAAQGLKWPRPGVGQNDPIVQHNVREHESQAAPLLATDPAAAVAMMERLIRGEEEKFKARSWRAQLARSAAEHGTPDPGLYRSMLQDLPGRYFDRMIEETLANHPLADLAGIAIEQALRREEKPRMAGLAAIIRNTSLDLDSREKAARQLAEQLGMSFDPTKLDTVDWTFEVGERFRSDPGEY
jgi:hypothetical protein